MSSSCYLKHLRYWLKRLYDILREDLNVPPPGSDPPWAPGKPTVRDVAKTSCFLMWTKPEHDGGAKIDGYIIEMLKSGTTDWIRVADDINLLEHSLRGLMEKQEYSFRVKAVNKAGESEPSEPSDPVLIKERLCKSNSFTIAQY